MAGGTPKLSFDGLVAIVTGAGGGLGASYAKLLGSRGASVVVNDLGTSVTGSGGMSSPADKVVADIQVTGGRAVADYGNVVTQAQDIVRRAVEKFGKVDILINNAGILRDTSFSKMDRKAWNIVQDVHVRGSYEMTKAVWPYMVKQKFGRIVMTASPTGMFGNFGQANYAAAKHALVGLGLTLAREGKKNHIQVNTIVPVAASRMTESVMPEEILKLMSPEYVAPLVAVICSKESQETGSVFELAGGYYTKLRWQRTPGHLFKLDHSFTPGSIQSVWDDIADFEKGIKSGKLEFPVNIEDDDWMGLLERATSPDVVNPHGKELRYDGRVAVVTGAGSGLGRAYAMLLAKHGAKVVCNDLGGSASGAGKSARAADAVVEEIKRLGGEACPNYDTVEEGARIVQTAMDQYGRIDILVNNAGILIDKSFAKLSPDEFHKVFDIHLQGTYACTAAAWPHMVAQKYGRIINTTSAVGLFGNFGQSNYSTGKAGIIGFTNALAIEGARKNILANVIAPNAGTRLTATVLPPEIVEKLRPEYVAPLIGYLAHEECATTRGIFQVGSGWIARLRWERAPGHLFADKVGQGVLVTPEDVYARWDKITEFDPQGRGVSPESSGDAFQSIYGLLESSIANAKQGNVSDAGETAPSHSDLQKSMALKWIGSPVSYTEKETLLYNLSVGARASDLALVYEGHSGFMPLPTFCVILSSYGFEFEKLGEVIPDFDLTNLLHGEQYFELHANPLPTSGTVENHFQVVDILSKGKHTVLVTGVTTFVDGVKVCYNEQSLFIRNTGGYGNRQPQNKPRSLSLVAHKPEGQVPDHVIDTPTLTETAAIYRLNGDRNPLHIDPDFAAMAGFGKPILHGLGFFGIVARGIVESVCGRDGGRVSKMKVRFASHVFPGETLRTRLWKVGSSKDSSLSSHGSPSPAAVGGSDQPQRHCMAFETEVVERGKVVISGGVVEVEGVARLKPRL